MKNYIIITCLLLLASFINAENLLKSNKFSRKNGWTFYIAKAVSKVGGSLRLVSSSAVIKSPAVNKQRWAGIQLVREIALPAGKNYKLSFKALTDKSGELKVFYGLRKAPYTHYSRSESIILKPGKENYSYTFRTKKNKNGNYGSPRVIRIGLGMFKNAKISIRDISLEEISPLAINSSWKLFLNVTPTVSFAKSIQQLKSSNGEIISPIIVPLNKDKSIDFKALCGKKFQTKDIAVLYNEFSCEKSGVMRMGVSADWWMEIYINGKKEYSTMTRGNMVKARSQNDHVVDFPVNAGKNLLAVKVLAGSKGWKFICGQTSHEPALSKNNIIFIQNSKWKVVDMSNLQVKRGSALDLSRVSKIELTESSVLPRLIIGKLGHLVSKNNPAQQIRLNGFSFGGMLRGLSRSDAADKSIQRQKMNKIIDLSRIQGYNLFRAKIELSCPNENLVFDKYFLDNVDYLLSRMKKQGIYMHFIIYAYHLFHNKKTWGPIWQMKSDNKIRMYLGDSVLRKEFTEIVTTLMNHVNPYTGIAWKDDPVFACIEAYNEQNLGLLYMHKAKIRPETRIEFNKQFRQWLKNKYKNIKNVSKSWKDKSITAFNKINIPKYMLSYRNKLKGQDFILFLNKLSRENIKWFEQTLRKAGYKGLTAQYNIPKWIGNIEARFETSQIAICNKYFKHPSNQTKKGSRCSQKSSVNEEAAYFCIANATRFADRPFVITEVNHSFWNKYQHEGGIVFNAYAALQGFSGIIAHASPVILSEKYSVGSYKDACTAFSIGNNPVARANAFLGAYLYLRGDVKTSVKRVQMNIPKSNMTDNKPVSLQQSKIALMTGFSVSFPWANPVQGVGTPKAPDMIISTDQNNTDIVKVGNWFTEIVSSKKSKSKLDAFVNKMKTKGLLPKSNISVPSKGIYQSDTGEIILRAKESLMKVCTPKSEAITFKSGKSESIGQLQLINSSVPALLAACSVDGNNLAESKRIVLIYSTETANTDMELSGNRVTMIHLGKRPALMRVGKLSASLKNNYAKNMSLYALDFDGSRREKLPLDYSDGVLRIKIATEKLKNGPTPFFELSTK